MRVSQILERMRDRQGIKGCNVEPEYAYTIGLIFGRFIAQSKNERDALDDLIWYTEYVESQMVKDKP